jgi:hypothetical protein
MIPGNAQQYHPLYFQLHNAFNDFKIFLLAEKPPTATRQVVNLIDSADLSMVRLQ